MVSRYVSALVPAVWDSVEMYLGEADGTPYEQIIINPAWAEDPIAIWKEEDGSMGVEHPGGAECQKVRSLAEALEPWTELVEALESYRERTKVTA